MEKFNIIDNKLTNLIPIVNPGLKNECGIKAAILYRILPSVEVDSSEIVRKSYEKFYGEDIPESADSIFNAFIPFLDFCRAKELKLKLYDKQRPQKDELALIFLNLEKIFDGYSDLKALFDRFFDLMYSFSNLMPAPKYFNGSDGKNGKGTWNLNKDYPSVYYKNLEDNNSGIYKREEMKQWLDEIMDKYSIKNMYMLVPPYPIKEYYGYNDDKLPQLISYIKAAIRLIEDRFEQDFQPDKAIGSNLSIQSE